MRKSDDFEHLEMKLLKFSNLSIKSWKFGTLSGMLWQGSNSKIENYGFLDAVTLFEKVLQPFLACWRN